MNDQARELRRLIEEGDARARHANGVAVLAAQRVSVGPSDREAPQHEDRPVDQHDDLSHQTTQGELPQQSEPQRAPARSSAPVASVLRPASRPLARAIAVTSGKGGVGKSNVAVNLAAAFAARGCRVCLIDGDLGLANADVLCNLTPRKTLDDVVYGRCKLGEAILAAPGGFHLLAGASGVARMANLTPEQQGDLVRRMTALEKVVDVILIDTGAGISRSVLDFNAAAHDVLVVVTPEPPSITDSYGLIKALAKQRSVARMHVIVNQARSEGEARSVFRRLDHVSRTFLQRPLAYAGHVPEDSAVRDCVRQRVPFVVGAPRSSATHCMLNLARYFSDLPAFASIAGATAQESSREGFFMRFAQRLRIR
ncbi:MAG: MinD/ParA family protein [Phycisphaerales bacterium]